MTSSKYSINLLQSLIVAAVLFIVCSCPVHALDVVDDLSGMLVVVNDGRPLPVNGGVVTGEQIGDTTHFDVSSLDLYIPFAAPSDNVIARLALLCSTADLNVSGSVQAGAYSQGVFYPHYDLSYSSWDYGYSTVGSTALTNTGYQVDTSSVPAADFAWYVHIRLSGSARFILYSTDTVDLSSSIGGQRVAVDNGNSSLSLTQRNGSFTLHDFTVNYSSGLYKSYYDAGKYVQVALAGMSFKANAGQTVTLSNGNISGTATNSDSHFTMPSEHFRTSGSSSRVVNTIRLSASRSDDDAEAVAELQKANATLTKISGDMDKFVNHQQEIDDTADNIGGTTSDGSISNTSTDFNSGIGTVDDFSTEATSHSQSLLHFTSGFTDLMTMATPVILNFGPDGHIGPLHIALLIVVAVLGVTFFVRRLL